MSSPRSTCYRTDVPDTDDHAARVREASLAGRGWRLATDGEAANLARLEVGRREALDRAADMLEARNALMRRLFADHVSPAEIARHLSVSRSTVDRVVRTTR